MELRSKSRAKRVSSALSQETTNLRPNTQPDQENTSLSDFSAPVEREPKKTKHREVELETKELNSRYRLRQKINKENKNPGLLPPSRSSPKSNSTRALRINKGNRNMLPNKSPPKAETSINNEGLKTSNLGDKEGSKSNQMLADTVEDTIQTPSINNIQVPSENCSRSSSITRRNSMLENFFSRDVDGSFISNSNSLTLLHNEENESSVDLSVDEDEELDQTSGMEDEVENEINYNEALERQLALSGDSSSFFLVDSELYFSQRLSEAIFVLERCQDPSIQLTILQNLAESLSVASEESLASFSKIKNLVKIMVKILKGVVGIDEEAFEALSGTEFIDEYPENMVLACRCLCNLIEANSSTALSIISEGAVQVMVARLREIRFIELAEQILQALKLLSQDFPTAIVRENGLSALLTYIDFFSTQVQRNAVLAAANCCKGLELTMLASVQEMLPLVQNILGFSDSLVVEHACLLLNNVLSSFQSDPEKLEFLFSPSLIGSIVTLISPFNPSRPETYTNFLSFLNTLAKGCPTIPSVLLSKNIKDVLKFNLIGPLSEVSNNHHSLSNISSRQIEIGLELSCSLLPPLPILDNNTVLSRAVQKLEIEEFGSVMGPIALELYNTNVAPFVKLSSLTLLYKLAVFSEPESLEIVFNKVPIGSFLLGILYCSEHALYSIRALQITLVLLTKLPHIYFLCLSREGVLNTIETLNRKSITRTLISQAESIGVGGEIFFNLTSSELRKYSEKLNAEIEKYAVPTSKSSVLFSESSETQNIHEVFFGLLLKIVSRKCNKLLTSPEITTSPSSINMLKSFVRGLSLDHSVASSPDFYIDPLIGLRDNLLSNDVTAFELSSIKLAQYLHYFLDSSSEGASYIARQDQFSRVFFSDKSGIDAIHILLKHFHSRIDQIETYRLLFYQKSENSVRSLTQPIKLQVIPGQGIENLPTFSVAIQIVAPLHLLAEHIKESLSADSLTSSTSSTIKFQYEGFKLDSNANILQALLQSGRSFSSIIGEVIQLKYFCAPNQDQWITKSSPGVGKLEEHEIIFRVLRAIHTMSLRWTSQHNRDCYVPRLDPSLFINLKLTAKLNRQLDEMVIVACSCLPGWCRMLITKFPFLFPFSTRVEFLQCTSFGTDRLLAKFTNSASMNTSEGVVSLGRMSKSKVRVPRNRLIESASKVAKLYGQTRSTLEFQFSDEVGSGQGPTLEFFSCVFQEFCKKELGLWRDVDSIKDSIFVNSPGGLFPRPRSSAELETASGETLIQHFKTLGWITAKALVDGRITDIPLSEALLELLLRKGDKVFGENDCGNLRLIRIFDPVFADSLLRLKSAKLEELLLTFELPGFDIELKPNGSQVYVTEESLQEYIKLVIDFSTNRGIRYALAAFEEGFNGIFPFKNLAIFSPLELTTVLGCAEEDWSREAIWNSIKAEHGYSQESSTIHRFINVVSGLDKEERQQFLQFITGSRKLPIGGFKALSPNLTVVRKQCESPLKPDDYLPSVNTCFNYLKLPEYSSENVMRERLIKAFQEGKLSFHLS